MKTCPNNSCFIISIFVLLFFPARTQLTTFFEDWQPRTFTIPSLTTIAPSINANPTIGINVNISNEQNGVFIFEPTFFPRRSLFVEQSKHNLLKVYIYLERQAPFISLNPFLGTTCNSSSDLIF